MAARCWAADSSSRPTEISDWLMNRRVNGVLFPGQSRASGLASTMILSFIPFTNNRIITYCCCGNTRSSGRHFCIGTGKTSSRTRFATTYQRPLFIRCLQSAYCFNANPAFDGPRKTLHGNRLQGPDKFRRISWRGGGDRGGLGFGTGGSGSLGGRFGSLCGGLGGRGIGFGFGLGGENGGIIGEGFGSLAISAPSPKKGCTSGKEDE